MKLQLSILLLVIFCSIKTYGQSIDSIQHTPYHIRNVDIETTAITNDMDKIAIGALGGSATGLLGRVSGVTFVGSNLVSVRGLSPRYTNVTLDGLAAPITEQTIKAYSLNLLPATAIQGLYINKSGSYDNQGEWGGAVINISTNAELQKNYNKASFAMGYQHNFTFQDYITDVDHETIFGDYLGYGVDRRNISNKVAGRNEMQNMSRDDAAEEAKNLNNTWGLKTKTASPSFSMGYSMGRILVNSGQLKLSTINSFTYSRSQGGAHFNRAKYSGYEFDDRGEAVSSEIDSYSTDGAYVTKADLNINSGWHLKTSDQHHYNLDLSYAHTGEFKTISKYMVFLTNNKEGYFARYSHLAKGVFLARLSGDNDFADNLQLKWTVGYGNSTRDEPDQRNSAAQRNLNQPDEPFILVVPQSSKADIGARFQSDMQDQAYSGRADLTYHFTPNTFLLKTGVMTEYNDRAFNARLLTSVKDNFTRPDLRFVDMSELSTAFAPENYGPDGYTLRDATTDFDLYTASNLLTSGYMGIDNSFANNVKSSIGFRLENFNQQLESGSVSVNNTHLDFLPYINASFTPQKNTVIKASYSQSVNRPAFREISPFIFYDFDYRADIQGNSKLENASLHNLDFSLLYLFGRNEYFSISPFYKKLYQPIEMIYIVRSDKPLFTFDNADEAELGGVEVEFSKFLSNDITSPISRLLFLGNFAYTQSAIQLGENTNEVASSRPLQGQVPIVLSAGLTYFNTTKTTQATVSYKYIGKSLFSVGDGQETFPWYNAPVNMLNASIGHTLPSNIELRLTGMNLLNARISQFEDTNFNGSIKDDVDKEVQRGLKYQSYNLSVSYKF